MVVILPTLHKVTSMQWTIVMGSVTRPDPDSSGHQDDHVLADTQRVTKAI